MPGRPRKKRIRAPHENKSTYKISRAGVEMTCLNCGEKGHNKKGCKNEPIPQTPKVPCKTGRPKKKVPIDTTSLVNEDDIPRFVNTEIDEYDRVASSNNVVFNNGRRIELGMNWNKNKCGKYVGNSYVKFRGGKTKKGGLIPAVRFGRIEKCLDVGESEPLHASFSIGNVLVANAGNVIGAKSVRGGRRKTRSGIKNTAGRSANAQAMQQRTGTSVNQQVAEVLAPIPPLVQERRVVIPLFPPREKSQRILQKKLFQPAGPGSSKDN
ncbi:pentatricopeptide repeat-containing protein [Tanacetum coccineum]